MANRFDVFSGAKWSKDSNNNLIVEATPTKSGVFFYYDKSGKRTGELRHPDEVFSRETLDSLNGVPYTTQDNHISLFTTNDTREKAYGVTVGEARQDGDMTHCKIKIWDQNEIDHILNGGSLELSNGYRCDVVDESGTYNGVAYDKKQVNIRYNHVARVQKARGGENCRIRLDSSDSAICGIEAERIDSGETLTNSLEKNMGEEKTVTVIQRQIPLREHEGFRLDSFSVETDQAHASIIDKFSDREEKLFNKLAEVTSTLTKNSVKLDSLTKENESLKEKSTGLISDERMDQEIENRLNLFSLAEKVGLKDYRSLAPSELGKEVVKASGMFNEDKLDSADYVKFAVEHLQEDHTMKIIKSRDNLKGVKLDNFEGDSMNKPSSLEMA